MTEIKTNAIPHRLKNVNKEHPYVSGARDIYDDELEMTQEQINASIIARIEALEQANQ